MDYIFKYLNIFTKIFKYLHRFDYLKKSSHLHYTVIFKYCSISVKILWSTFAFMIMKNISLQFSFL